MGWVFRRPFWPPPKASVVTTLSVVVTTAVAGIVMAAPRAYGILTTKVPVQSTIRSAPLVRGNFGEKPPLAGTIRVSPRAYGTLTTRVSLSGVVRVAPRIVTDASVSYYVSESMAHPRAFGTLTTASIAPLRGTVVSTPRVFGTLTTRQTLNGVCRAAPRLIGQIRIAEQVVQLSGTIRSAPRLISALNVRIPLTGVIRAAPRVVSALNVRLPLQGTVRSTGVHRGQLRIAGVVTDLSGVIRSTALLNAPTLVIRPGFVGRIVVAPRCYGNLRTRVALVSTVRVAPRVIQDVSVPVYITRVVSAPRVYGFLRTEVLEASRCFDVDLAPVPDALKPAYDCVDASCDTGIPTTIRLTGGVIIVAPRLWGQITTGPAPEIMFEDLFDGNLGTLITNHAPDHPSGLLWGPSGAPNQPHLNGSGDVIIDSGTTLLSPRLAGVPVNFPFGANCRMSLDMTIPSTFPANGDSMEMIFEFGKSVNAQGEVPRSVLKLFIQPNAPNYFFIYLGRTGTPSWPLAGAHNPGGTFSPPGDGMLSFLSPAIPFNVPIRLMVTVSPNSKSFELSWAPLSNLLAVTVLGTYTGASASYGSISSSLDWTPFTDFTASEQFVFHRFALEQL